MATPAEVVAESFAQAHNYAQAAQSQLNGFTSALSASIYAPPTIDANWSSLAAPSITALPSLPSLPGINFVPPTAPGVFTLDEPTLVIVEFAEVAPTTDFPTAPTLEYGATPSIPAVGSVAMPSAPTLDMPSTPSYLALNIPTFGGVDLHEDWLTKFDNIPTLDLVSPTPFSYAPGPEYASTLLTNLKTTLNSRLSGGTGLSPAIEQAIWDRARSRETQNALANEAEVMRNSEALGFQLPAGVLAAQLRQSQQDYYDKLSTLSRDIAIKQADLEQENLKQTIAAGMELEGKLIDYSFKLEQLSFEAAKAAAENAIQAYNAQVEQYKALISVYGVYSDAYKTIISAELAKVEVFRAQIAAEQAKADINKTLVEQYKATIEASLAQVQVFTAEVGAAKVLVEIEGLKISAAGEQIKAYVAQVNAETAKIEAYKAGVDAETAKIGVYKVKADVFAAKVGAQAEQARLELGRYDSLVKAKMLEWDGYRAMTEAEKNRMQSLAAQSGALVDGFKAAASATEAEAGMHARIWEAQIKEYEAGQNFALQAAKVNNDAMQFSYASLLDASKVGAQVYAQLTSSAYSMIHASAGVSASSGTSVSYSYSNDTESAPPSITTI